MVVKKEGKREYIAKLLFLLHEENDLVINNEHLKEEKANMLTFTTRREQHEVKTKLKRRHLFLKDTISNSGNIV
jgi:hypothetical protein